MGFEIKSRSFLAFLFLIILLALLAQSAGLSSRVKAQESNLVNVSPPDVTAFPSIQAFMNVRDQEGKFLYGLEKENVDVLENERRIQASELDYLQPGAQVVFVINPGPAFAIRDSSGLSRYDYVVQHLQTWAGSQVGTTKEDLSILGTQGVEITHLDSVEDWLSGLVEYQPDARDAVPDFDLLTRGLEVAADSTPRAGMGRVVIFITSLPQEAASIGFQSLVSRAIQAHVPIHVWLVASPGLFGSQGGIQLSEMSTQTGGQFFGYSGVEELPDIEQILEPLRNIYSLKYLSQIANSGVHQISVRVNTEDFDAISNEQSFELEVLPPNIAFVSPALELKRTFLFEGGQDPDELTPKSQSIEVIIEFPDGHARDVKQTTLYVNGQIEDRNTIPPYDYFSWDLSDYTSSGIYTIQAEVIDDLDMRNITLELPVRVVIETSPVNILGAASRNRLLLGGVSTALACAILLLFLVRGGKLQPGSLGLFRRIRKRKKASLPAVSHSGNPKTQKQPYWVNRVHWPLRKDAPEAIAYLTRLTEYEEAEKAMMFPITSVGGSLGSDPSRVTIQVDEPSVAPLHALMINEGNGTFLLKDEGSIAGTWINYSMVPQEGMQIEHGDIVHIGRVRFRFTLREPKKVPRVVIIEEDWRK